MTKKDFTIRKRVNRGKLIAGMTACFFALTSLLSCVNQIDDINSEASYSGTGRILLTGKLDINGAVPEEVFQNIRKTGAERSAIPVIPESGFDFYVEGIVTAPEEFKDEKVSGTIEDGVYTIELTLGRTYTITAGLKKGVKNVLIDTWENVEVIRANAGSLQKDFCLKPAEGEGFVALQMTVPASAPLKITDVDKVTFECSDDGLDTSKLFINASSTLVVFYSTAAIPAGQYEVTFYFYNKDDILLYFSTQTINVLPELTTDTWIDSGSSVSPITAAGEFVLTEAIINSFKRTQIYVGDTRVGTASDSGSGSPYSPFNAVGKALDLIKTNNTASNDYTIWISGSFTENLSLDSSFNSLAHKLTFCGLSELNDGIPQDVIKGTGSGSVLTINTSVPVELKNVKITGGNSSMGGGIALKADTTLTLDGGTVVTGNSAERGGGISVGGWDTTTGGKLILKNCKIYGNTAVKGWGGGVFCEDKTKVCEVEISGSSVEIYNNTATNNKDWNGQGGGVTVSNGILTMSAGKIYGNTAYQGGGVKIGSERAAFIMTGGEIYGNNAPNGGGVHNSCNTAPASGITYGFTMKGGTIRDNSASENGGAVFNDGYFQIEGNASIPYDSTASNKNDFYLNTDKFIKVTGMLQSDTKPIATIATSSYSRGIKLIEADGTVVTNLEAYTDYFTSVNNDWNIKLSADTKKLVLDSPIYVSTSGSSAANTTGTKDDPFRTIQDAISTALTDTNVDYTILIDGELRATTVDNNGTINGYAQEIIDPPDGSTIKAKSITIRGASASNGNPTDVINGLSEDGTKTARGLFIGTKIPVTIENLKITGGLADEGGGIYLSGEDTTLTLGNDVLITGNKAKNSGGGIYLTKNTSNKTPTLNIKGNVKICDNTNSESGDPSNLYLPEGAKITVTGALTKGSNMAKIGISTGSEPSLTSRVAFTMDYGLYNSDTAPGTYFTGDKWNVAWGSGTSSNEAALAASGGNITIEPVYEDITINVDKSSVLKSATEKKFTFSAIGIDSEGNSRQITIGSGEGKLALSVDSVTYHGETVPASYYGTGTDYVTLGNSLPAGNYTINTKAVYKGLLSEARTYSPSFDVVIKEYLGSKKSTDSKDVGDIVFNDGSAMPYSEFSALDTASKNELKTNAIALIFYKGTDLNNDYDDGTPDATTVRTLGVGLKQYKDCFCTAMANAYNENIITIQCTFSGSPWNYSFTGDKNGSDNYDQIAGFLGSNNDTESISSYCAFNNAVNYKDGKLSSENMTRIISNSEYASGWYFPSIAELFWIYKNGKLEEKVFDIDEAIAALGGDKFENNTYMSSSQSSNTAKKIYTLTSTGCSQIEKNEGRKQCCYIREF